MNINQQETIGERLKRVRKAFGYKQKEFSELLGFGNLQTLSNVETGVKTVSHAVIMKLVNEFGIDMKWIIRGEGVMIYDEKLADTKMKEDRKTDTPSVKDDKEAILHEIAHIKELLKSVETRMKNL